MSETKNHLSTVEIIHCARCGSPFGVQKHQLDSLRETGKTFYCPSGHSNVYTKTKADLLSTELAKVKRDLEWEAEQNRRNRQDAAHYKKSRDAYKGQVTKIRKRVANGVCPCCNRTFQNLREHMLTQHPDFQTEEPPND